MSQKKGQSLNCSAILDDRSIVLLGFERKAKVLIQKVCVKNNFSTLKFIFDISTIYMGWGFVNILKVGDGAKHFFCSPLFLAQLLNNT